MVNISIYVLTHKQINENFDKTIYKPLLNGSINCLEDYEYLRDDSGENISNLNEYYAEMTGEYWAWKNSTADIIGFCHYRRYFARDFLLKKLEKENIEKILQDYDIIMPNKAHMGMTNIEDIKKTKKFLNYGPDIEEYCKLREVIEEYYFDYLEYYDEMLNEKECYWFNMFICKKEYLDFYQND